MSAKKQSFLCRIVVATRSGKEGFCILNSCLEEDISELSLHNYAHLLLGKGKISSWYLVQSCPTLGGGVHPRFQAVEPVFVWRKFPWSRGQHD